MKEIKKNQIDWEKTGINLQLLRNDNIRLRRYVCFFLRRKRGECEDDCDACRYKMDNSISRAELAEVFNVSESVIYNWEKGKTPLTIEDLLFYCDIAETALRDVLCFV
ncbi:MAG: helix-turn-helix transcriptional regulator [Clostridia bacterium]|nr:helix-turn-helix transcriptional regulator [Clostridia bacterium]